jgi:hypothetical protein
MSKRFPLRRLWVAALLLTCGVTVGCGGQKFGGLATGAVAPTINADGWLIGDESSASNLTGKVAVVVAWAYW